MAITDERLKYLQTAGYYGAFISLGLSRSSLGPTLLRLSYHVHVSLSEISILFVMASIGNLIGAFFGGRLFDRFAGHRIMIIMLFSIGVIIALMPFTTWLLLLMALVLLLGAVQGTLDTGSNTLLVWVHRGNIGPFMNGLHFCYGLGALFSPILVAKSLSWSNDIYWAYGIIALLMLPVALTLFWIPSPPHQGKANDIPSNISWKKILPVCILLFLVSGADVGFTGWIYTYTIKLGYGNEEQAAYLTSAFWIAYTVARLISIPLVARLRPRIVQTFNYIGSILFIVFTLAFANSFILVLVGTVGTGFFMATIFPTTLSLAERRMHITGRITGWFFSGASLGAMLFPWLIGQLFEPLGPPLAMSILIVLLATSAIVFFFYVRVMPPQSVGDSVKG